MYDLNKEEFRKVVKRENIRSEGDEYLFNWIIASYFGMMWVNLEEIFDG